MKNKVSWPSWPSVCTPYLCNRYNRNIGHFSLYVKKYNAKKTHGHALCFMAFGYRRSSWHLSICLVCLVGITPPKSLKLQQQWHVKSLEPEICKGRTDTCEHLPVCQWHKGHRNLFLGSHSESSSPRSNQNIGLNLPELLQLLASQRNVEPLGSEFKFPN